MRSVRDADVAGKRVLVRVDFNVPLKDGQVAEDMRIRAAVPTLELLHERGAASLILITHIGRPEGKVVEDLRTAPVLERLRELTQVPFTMEENLRFDPGEEANDPAFAEKLASLGDVFVNDAFAVSHRPDASIVGVPKLLPSYAGLLMEKEVHMLSHALVPPPGAIAILGGAKLETKLPLIEKFARIYGKVLVGGAIANEYVSHEDRPQNALLPQDGTPQLIGMFDIGPQTQQAWSREIIAASFVLWNGPVGMYEKQEFAQGTDALASALASASAPAVIGGGDTAAAIAKFTFDSARIFISTGGGSNAGIFDQRHIARHRGAQRVILVVHRLPCA